MTKAQVLTVENPLGMYDGCYAKQRDGVVVGPWKWDGSGQMLVGWWCGREHRHSDGRWAAARLDGNADLVAVVPAPLPEPIERYNVAGEKWFSSILWTDSEKVSARDSAEKLNAKLYRVRVEFLEEVTL